MSEKSEEMEIEAAARAWDLATAGITGAKVELAMFKMKFVMAIVAGQPLTDLEGELEDTMTELDWEWPWFEEWYKTFTEWGGTYPFLWPQLVPDPDPEQPYSPEELAAYRKAGIAPLMAHTAAMIYFRDRHLSKAHMHQKYRLRHLNDGAEMRVATQKEIAIMSGDMSSLPPFFPGDRTTLQPQNPIGPKDDKRPDSDAKPDMKMQGGLMASMPPKAEPVAEAAPAPAAKAKTTAKAKAPAKASTAKTAAKPKAPAKPKSAAKPKSE